MSLYNEDTAVRAESVDLKVSRTRLNRSVESSHTEPLNPTIVTYRIGEGRPKVDLQPVFPEGSKGRIHPMTFTTKSAGIRPESDPKACQTWRDYEEKRRYSRRTKSGR